MVEKKKRASTGARSPLKRHSGGGAAAGPSKRRRSSGGSANGHSEGAKATGGGSAGSSTAAVRYPFEPAGVTESVKCGERALQWLLSPLETGSFFETFFEKKHKLVRRNGNENKFACLLSLADVRAAVVGGNVLYGTDLDVTRYTPATGKKQHNGDAGAAVGTEAWHEYETGASLRFRRPQLQFDPIYRLCAHIEEFLECVVGANVYVTPPGSQGFAPHFDDVDAFVCQVAGSKRWRVYSAFDSGHSMLPRSSSIDFAEHDLAASKVLVDEILHPGDMLYLPRGTIHEARTLPATADNSDDYSVHVTVSMFQRWTWADLLEHSVVSAVRSAAAQDKTLRKTLPLRFGRFAGAQCAGDNPPLRDWFHSKVGTMVARIAKLYPTDSAADQLMRNFTRDRLPPPQIADRQAALKDAAQRTADPKLTQASKIRAVCAGAARIVIDEDGLTEGLPRLISCVKNSKSREPLDYSDEHSVSCLANEAQAIDTIIKAYPDPIKVADIPLPDKKDRVDLVLGLVEMGIVETV